MQENRQKILDAITLLCHHKVKYHTFPKWVRFADITLTIVYIVTLLAGVSWLVWQIVST